MKLIKDGKMQGWFEGILINAGLNIGFYGLFGCAENSVEQIGLVTIGLGIAGVGGYSARASTWKIKSFNNLTFPKNKEGESNRPDGLTEEILWWVAFGGIGITFYYWIWS